MPGIGLSRNTQAGDDPHRPVGILAGWGRLPLIVAQALRRQGRTVVGLGIRDHADPQLAEVCDHFQWIGLGSIGQAIRLLRRRGVEEATMVGKIHKVLLLKPRWWFRHRPDWTAFKAFAPSLLYGKKDSKDDTLLGIVVDTFADGGIRFLPATDIAPELLVNSGHLAGRRLSAKQQKDVEFGWQLAKQMGRLDVGQTVCVMDQIAVAIEAIEGTDLCIHRAGELCAKGGFAVVKVAKPQQDMRYDVPTVGVKTLRSIAQAGGRVLAVEADRTILLDQDEFLSEAERLKLSVVALAEPAQAVTAA